MSDDEIKAMASEAAERVESMGLLADGVSNQDADERARVRHRIRLRFASWLTHYTFEAIDEQGAELTVLRTAAREALEALEALIRHEQAENVREDLDESTECTNASAAAESLRKVL